MYVYPLSAKAGSIIVAGILIGVLHSVPLQFMSRGKVEATGTTTTPTAPDFSDIRICGLESPF